MATPRLNFNPVRDSYTLTPAYNTVEVRLDGGKSRKRRDFLGGVHIITPTWILTGVEYTSFMGFFRERMVEGSLKFIGKFLTDYGVVCDHVCTLAGGMPKLTSQSGDAFFVSATLEVIPNPVKSFAIEFQNAGGAPSGRVIDTGSDIYAGDMSEFPIGGTVQIAQSRQTRDTWGGVIIDVDGVYEISAKPTTFSVDLLNAHLVNTAWTTLGGLTPTNTTPGVGVFILLPD